MIYFFIPILIAFDAFTKYIAYNFLWETHFLLWKIIFLRYIENTGIAFSIPVEGLILKILTLVIITYFVYYYFREEKHKNNIWIDTSFILIFSWAIGNAYERIFRDGVIDFIGIQGFAIFNIADVYITVWLLLYITLSFLEFRKKKWDHISS